MKNKYYVYRFKDKDNNILYVGRTHDLEQRFRQHTHLTDSVITIEYIECPTKTDMVIKEIYYINKFFNEKSTNVKDVYDKPSNFNFKDKWINYKNFNKIERHKNSRHIHDYDKIYVVKIEWFLDDDISTNYYIGGYTKEGSPNVSDDPNIAKRVSDFDAVQRLSREIKNAYIKLYPELEEHKFEVKPAIYKEDEIYNYLFNYYNNNKTVSNELFFEDQYLDILQGCCINTLINFNKNKTEFLKLFKNINSNLSANEYASREREELKRIEDRRIELRDNPEWVDPIWSEEFVKPYIKNNYNPEKALEELFENRKNNYKDFTFELHKCFLPQGYRNY